MQLLGDLQSVVKERAMHPVLAQSVYFVKEHVGMFKAANNYDIHDPESDELLMECREPNLSMLTKLFRFTDYKR